MTVQTIAAYSGFITAVITATATGAVAIIHAIKSKGGNGNA